MQSTKRLPPSVADAVVGRRRELSLLLTAVRLRKPVLLVGPPGVSKTTMLRVLAGHHQPLRVWVLCLYLMGLNLSNRQIAEELGLSGSDVQVMTEQLRRGLAAEAPAAVLDGEVEIDEVYVVAGPKGQPAAVAKRGASGGVAAWRGRRAAARWRRTSRRSSA